MYGYRQTNDNGLMTNLDSISSSLSSIDTIGQRRTNAKVASSADNLIAPRTHSIASNSLLWRPPKEDRSIYSGSIQATRPASITGRCNGSEIYYNGDVTTANANLVNSKSSNHNSRHNSSCCCCCCFQSHNTLDFMLMPLLALTILRQVFDFMGQIWLQILINFFTIIIIIVALFGVRQNRISYLLVFLAWSLFNATWNTLVFCIHSKVRDVGIPEDLLSFYTGTSSWWRSNGPGCLPHSITSLHTSSVTMLNQPNSMAGCRIDYHLIEEIQAIIHAILSFASVLVCSCLITNIRRNPAYYKNYLHNTTKMDKAFRLNNLSLNGTKVNQDPYPNHSSSARLIGASNSLRRAPNKTSSRSSQHSIASMRSSRKRPSSSVINHRRPHIEATNMPTPRGSTSSTMRSQKYGSISSKRSSSRRERRSDVSSLTYGTTSQERSVNNNNNINRDRLSSLSSVDYLPSYQPPHSSSANLLSSYGELSSIDSFNNQNGTTDHRRSSKRRQIAVKSVVRGNMNPTYSGSRSSICTRNTTNGNNYDDISCIYGNNHMTNGTSSTQTFENRSHRNNLDNSVKLTSASNAQQQAQLYGTQRNMRHPIYSNHEATTNGNSETPI